MSEVVKTRDCNAFMPICSKENNAVDVNRTTTTGIGNLEPRKLGEGHSRTRVISPNKVT